MHVPRAARLVLADCLRRNRLACGLSQDAVAEYLGVSLRAVRYWEKGQRVPNAELAPRLVEYLELSARDAMRVKLSLQGLTQRDAMSFTDFPKGENNEGDAV